VGPVRVLILTQTAVPPTGGLHWPNDASVRSAIAGWRAGDRGHSQTFLSTASTDSQPDPLPAGSRWDMRAVARTQRCAEAPVSRVARGGRLYLVAPYEKEARKRLRARWDDVSSGERVHISTSRHATGDTMSRTLLALELSAMRPNARSWTMHVSMRLLVNSNS
jgi:hypothetical protein